MSLGFYDFFLFLIDKYYAENIFTNIYITYYYSYIEFSELFIPEYTDFKYNNNNYFPHNNSYVSQLYIEADLVEIIRKILKLHIRTEEQFKNINYRYKERDLAKIFYEILDIERKGYITDLDVINFLLMIVQRCFRKFKY